jgi:hypothetical protein
MMMDVPPPQREQHNLLASSTRRGGSRTTLKPSITALAQVIASVRKLTTA